MYFILKLVSPAPSFRQEPSVLKTEKNNRVLTNKDTKPNAEQHTTQVDQHTTSCNKKDVCEHKTTDLQQTSGMTQQTQAEDLSASVRVCKNRKPNLGASPTDNTESKHTKEEIIESSDTQEKDNSRNSSSSHEEEEEESSYEDLFRRAQEDRCLASLYCLILLQ
jgi:hypothetical protein